MDHADRCVGNTGFDIQRTQKAFSKYRHKTHHPGEEQYYSCGQFTETEADDQIQIKKKSSVNDRNNV